MAFIKVKDCLSDPRQSVKLILLVVCICITIYQLSQCVTKMLNPPITSHYKFRYNESIKYPALTICRRPSYKTHLFKDFGVANRESVTYENSFIRFDFNTTTIEQFTNATTYSFAEMFLLYGYKGDGLGKNVAFTNTLLIERGLCHTIIPKETADINMHVGYYLYLKHDSNDRSRDPNGFLKSGFEIYIHNEHYIITDGANAQSAFLYLESGEDVYATLTVQSYSQISTAQQPCVSDSTYSKSRCEEKCFHNKVAQKIGCTAPWLRYVDQQYPLCNNNTSMNKLWEEFNHRKKRQFMASCNCLIPCNNSVYSYQIENRRDTSGSVNTSSNININFHSNLVTEVSDVISYDWNVFLADVGGSLGFLLGLSVISVITVVEQVIKMMFAKPNEEEEIVEEDNEPVLPRLEDAENKQGESLKSVMEFVAQCDIYEYLQKEKLVQNEQLEYI